MIYINGIFYAKSAPKTNDKAYILNLGNNLKLTFFGVLKLGILIFFVKNKNQI